MRPPARCTCAVADHCRRSRISTKSDIERGFKMLSAIGFSVERSERDARAAGEVFGGRVRLSEIDGEVALVRSGHGQCQERIGTKESEYPKRRKRLILGYRVLVTKHGSKIFLLGAQGNANALGKIL